VVKNVNQNGKLENALVKITPTGKVVLGFHTAQIGISNAINVLKWMVICALFVKDPIALKKKRREVR